MLFYVGYLLVQNRLGKWKVPIGTFFQLCFYSLLVHQFSKDTKEVNSTYQYFFLATLERIIMTNCQQFRGQAFFFIIILVIRYSVLTPKQWIDIVCLVITDVSILVTSLSNLWPAKPKSSKYETAHSTRTRTDEILRSLTSQSFPCPFALINRVTQNGLWINEKLSLIMKNLNIPDITSFLKQISLDLKQPRNGRSGSSLLDNTPTITLNDYLRSNNPENKSIDRYIARINLKSKVPIYYEVREADGWFEGQEVKLLIFFDLNEQETLKKMKELNEYKDKALAMVSHDLRTPLNGIIGMIKVIEQRIEDKEVLKYLNACRSLAAVQLNIVNTYLDASSMEKKKLKLVPREFNLKEFLEDLHILYGLLCKQKHLQFKIAAGEKLPKKLKTDKNRLRQILINLLSNSLKFTITGHITLHIKTDEENPDLIYFGIEDTGLGIKEEDQKKLFHAFSTIDNPGSINPYGVGLGLIISNQLVHLLNPITKSTIKVESEYGKGSTFSFKVAKYIESPREEKKSDDESLDDSLLNESVDDDDNIIPVSTPNDLDSSKMNVSTFQINSSKFFSLKSYDHSPKSTTSLLAESPYLGSVFRGGKQIISLTEKSEYIKDLISKPHFATERSFKSKYVKKVSKFAPKEEEDTTKPSILVIDDNAFNLLVTTKVLESTGYIPKTCSHGLEGINELIEKAKDNHFYKAVLMDCDMPGMDGFEVTLKIKELINQNQIPPVPIIALTAYNDDQTKEKCKNSGMAAVLTKPLRVEKFMKILREVT